MKKSNDYTALVTFMKDGNLKTVNDWNDRREEAKEKYTAKALNALDGSGLIHKLKLKNTN